MTSVPVPQRQIEDRHDVTQFDCCFKFTLMMLLLLPSTEEVSFANTMTEVKQTLFEGIAAGLMHCWSFRLAFKLSKFEREKKEGQGRLSWLYEVVYDSSHVASNEFKYTG